MDIFLKVRFEERIVHKLCCLVFWKTLLSINGLHICNKIAFLTHPLNCLIDGQSSNKIKIRMDGGKICIIISFIKYFGTF